MRMENVCDGVSFQLTGHPVCFPASRLTTSQNPGRQSLVAGVQTMEIWKSDPIPRILHRSAYMGFLYEVYAAILLGRLETNETTCYKLWTYLR